MSPKHRLELGGSNSRYQRTTESGFQFWSTFLMKMMSEMVAMRKVLLLVLVFPLLAGCGTFVARTPLREECGGLTRVYPATWADIDLVLIHGAFAHYETETRASQKIGLFCIGVLDTPISLVTDTLCLPVDVYYLLFRKHRVFNYDWSR